MMKRDDLVEEMLLRENIRKIIKIVKTRQKEEKSKEVMAEQLLRKAIRNILVEKAAVPDEIPNRSTGINVLEDLLKKIIPVLETDFKSLTTSAEQRGSFRAHILNGIQNIIAVASTNADAGIIITASHNPRNWNALKLLNAKGEFLSARDGEQILQLAESEDFSFSKVDEIGKYTFDSSYNDKHIDEVLVLIMDGPKSFTGEDVVEINCHGGFAVIDKISQSLEKLGARQATPGEFTKRALLNDKIDLVKTESISDIINAETEKQREMAIKNLSGGLNEFTLKINEKLSAVLANIEALIDFSDEDLPKNILNKIKEQNKNIIKEITKELKIAEKSKPIREGVKIGIIGKPNTGKSSFINYISNKEVSIVTNIPGTTTDSVTSAIDIKGVRFTFFDTAGLRKHKNKIEEIGIKKTKQIIEKSDLNIIFLKADEKNKYKDVSNKIFVRSMSDIRKNKRIKESSLNISSKTGSGISRLLDEIYKKTVKKNIETPVLSRERHINIMKKILTILNSIDFESNLDIISFEYREALNLSLEINQKFDIEKILDIIFKDFCIGK